MRDRVAASQDRIYPAAAQREPVLQQHFNLAKPGLDQIVSQDRDAALPRSALTRRRPRHQLVMQELLEHHLSHAGPVRQRGKAGGRAAERRTRRRRGSPSGHSAPILSSLHLFS
jgi:hypothetical protein